MSGEKSSNFVKIPNLTSLGSENQADREATTMIKPQKGAFSGFLWSNPPKNMMIAPADVTWKKNVSLVVKAPKNIVRPPPTIERTDATPNLPVMLPVESFRSTNTTCLFATASINLA